MRFEIVDRRAGPRSLHRSRVSQLKRGSVSDARNIESGMP